MHDVVCDDLRRQHGDYPLTATVIADLQARKQLGLQRYGRILQAGNGRNALLDLYEEVQDAAAYCRQRAIEASGTPEADALAAISSRLMSTLLAVRRLMDARHQPVTHQCPAAGCTTVLDSDLLFCRRHWRMVPAGLRLTVYRAWRQGKGAGTRELAAAQQRAITAVNGKIAKETSSAT